MELGSSVPRDAAAGALWDQPFPSADALPQPRRAAAAQQVVGHRQRRIRRSVMAMGGRAQVGACQRAWPASGLALPGSSGCGTRAKGSGCQSPKPARSALRCRAPRSSPAARSRRARRKRWWRRTWSISASRSCSCSSKLRARLQSSPRVGLCSRRASIVWRPRGGLLACRLRCASSTERLYSSKASAGRAGVQQAQPPAPPPRQVLALELSVTDQPRRGLHRQLRLQRVQPVLRLLARQQRCPLSSNRAASAATPWPNSDFSSPKRRFSTACTVPPRGLSQHRGLQPADLEALRARVDVGRRGVERAPRWRLRPAA